MNTVNKTIVVICFSLVAVFANANNKPNSIKSETEQIQSYLGKLEFNKVITSSVNVKISFMINDANEMVITSTNSDNLDALIKSGLNYKQINVNTLERNTVYIIPVRVVLKN
jgi:hypothetical protein